MSQPHEQHESRAESSVKREPIRCAVVTISDTRTPETDESGALIEQLLRKAGHLIASREIVPDDANGIQDRLEASLSDPKIDVILTTGGTGIAARDRTVEVVRELLSVELEGFGEIFRMISYEQIGPAAMMSRSLGGLVTRDDQAGGDTFIFALPGSSNAVRTTMERLLIPQLPHLVWQRRA